MGHQRSIRVALGAAVLTAFVACGGNDTPDADTTATAGNPTSRREVEQQVPGDADLFAEQVRQLPGVNAGDRTTYSPEELTGRASIIVIGTITSVEPKSNTLTMSEQSQDLVTVGVEVTIDPSETRIAEDGNAQMAAPNPVQVFIPIDSQSPWNADAISTSEGDLLAAAPTGGQAIVFLMKVDGVDDLVAGVGQLLIEGSGGSALALVPGFDPAEAEQFSDVTTAMQALEPLT